MAKLNIQGPRENHEKSGADLHWDTRRWQIRAREFLSRGTTCASLLAGAAAVVAAVPGTVEFLFVPGVAYAGLVMCGRVRLPLSLPMKAQMRDPNDRDHKGRMRIGSGADYLGHERDTKRQIWHRLNDIPQHAAIPGTTGAGKTQALKSIALLNALAQGSGVLYVDGKGQTSLYAEFMAECRKWGREDDVLVLNFLTANESDSCTLSPFVTARANMIREILVGQMNEPGQEGNSSLFHGRAIAFLGIIAPILEWMRAERGVVTTLERVRDLTQHSNVIRIATKRQVVLTDSRTGNTHLIDLQDMPNDYVQGLRDYLGQTGGYDLDVSEKEQRSTAPADQHSYITMQFTEVFSQWLMTLGHIFRTESGDIDMRDVVLNRRILVVILPVLEGSEKTTAALGKIVVAMLRSVMAHSLGSAIEGKYDEIIANQPTEALASFRVVFDELVYYATSGMDSMMAMARSLRMQFLLGFQEAAGLRARLGERLYSLLGNANLQVIMRLQEGGETRSYVEKSTGHMDVTRSTSFQSTSEITNGTVSAPHAEVRQVERVSWADVRKLKPGEAIIVYGSRLIHAQLPYLASAASGYVRRNRPCLVQLPKKADLDHHAELVTTARKALLAGAGSVDADEAPEVSPGLHLLLTAFSKELSSGTAPAVAGFRAAGALPEDTPISLLEVVAVEGPEPEPDHAFAAMLRAASTSSTADDAGGPAAVFSVDREMLKTVTEIERFGGGLTVAEAGIAARNTMALYAGAAKAPQPTRMPAVQPEHLVHLIETLTAAIEPKVISRQPEPSLVF